MPSPIPLAPPVMKAIFPSKLAIGIDLKSAGRTNRAWVRSLSPWQEGDVYDPEDVGELVADGILADSTYIVTHGFYKDAMRARAEAVLAATPDRVEDAPDFGQFKDESNNPSLPGEG